MKRLILFLLTITLAGATVRAQEDEPLPDIAWTVGGELWLASADMEPVRVVDADACCAIFSQGGARLTFNLGDFDTPQMMVLDLANPTQPRAVASDAVALGEIPVSISWGDEDTLYFNIVRQSEGGGSSLLTFDPALLRLDVESDQVTTFPATGVPFPNPRGDLVAVVDPGIYQETPTTFALLNADGDLLSSHQHPAISSASHMGWVTRPMWITSADGQEGIVYALAHPDAAYTEFGQTPPPTQLYEAFFQEGDPVLRGEVITPFPVRVLWSPDGSQVAYLSPPDEDSLFDIMLMPLADGEPLTLMEALPFGASLIDWREELAIYHPERGLILWTPEETVEIPGVLGVTAHPDGGWVLVKTDDTISLYRDGETQVIARDMNAFDVTLADTSP